MAITSLTYAAPVRRLPRPLNLDYALLEAASAASDDGHVDDAIHKVFAHLFPGAAVGDLAAQPFTFVQGSSQVTARVEDGQLAITVPLVRLPPTGNAVAALRYALTTISGSGQLYQPRLRGDELYLEFRDKLTRMHPAKVLEVLRRMPVEADRCDDWLVGQFGAQPLERAAIEPLSDDELARAEAVWRTHWDEVEELLKESQRKRSTWFLNEVSAIALFRVQFVQPICGYLLARISESAAVWNDGQGDPAKREAALARTAREMKAVTSAELRANLGHARYALAPLAEGQPSTLAGYFGSGDYIETIDKYRTQGKSFEAALALISSCTYLLARYAWPEDVAAALMDGLAKAGGKPWRDAAALLWDHCKGLVEQFCGDATGDEGGGEGGEPDGDDAELEAATTDETIDDSSRDEETP